MNASRCECEHEFTLVLAGISELTQNVVDALFEAGCDDATIASRSGRIVATFSRTAPSLKDAILTAIRCVRKANVGADVLRVDSCNLVTQADIARNIGRSRQLVHQYWTGARGPGGFPPPACELCDGTSLWLWCEVAFWLWEHDMIKEDVLRNAQQVEAINSVLEMEWQKRANRELTEEVMRAVSVTL
jgi:hypothetical protein